MFGKNLMLSRVNLEEFHYAGIFSDYFAKCSDILPPDEGICEAEFFFFPQFLAGLSSHQSILQLTTSAL